MGHGDVVALGEFAALRRHVAAPAASPAFVTFLITAFVDSKNERV